MCMSVYFECRYTLRIYDIAVVAISFRSFLFVPFRAVPLRLDSFCPRRLVLFLTGQIAILCQSVPFHFVRAVRAVRFVPFRSVSCRAMLIYSTQL